eukprot:c18829_g1_i1.p1 GENE.c18829_g1_i1~~c18829_g1_i1.p1  ORF type:complete len:106 (-),score=48.71 c18829_g1_i1:27-344(-)
MSSKPYTDGELLANFQTLFQFIEKATSEGKSVLIHCLAGAHRAGTSGVAFLMHIANLDYQTALNLAQICRPVISPWGRLSICLTRLERAQKSLKESQTAIVKEEQ